jgi:DNA polymerase-3 subunit delta
MVSRAAGGPPQPITLISGSDDLLVSRAINAVVSAARALDPMAEVSDYAAGTFTAAEALTLSNPSLFGGWRVVVVRAIHEVPDDVGSALTAFAAEPMPEIALVLTTSGRASALVNALRKLKIPEVKAAPITQAWKRVQFAADEAKRLGGRITDDAAKTLVEAVGSDLGAIAGAVEQLLAGAGPRGLINDEIVSQHFRGRAETSGFTIADAVLAGELDRGLTLLRQSLEVGTPPVFIPSALAGGLRDIARISALREVHGQTKAELARALQMPDWKIERTQKLARFWSDEALGKAFVAVAEADEGVKGGATDAAYALERAVIAIVAARENRTVDALLR